MGLFDYSAFLGGGGVDTVSRHYKESFERTDSNTSLLKTNHCTALYVLVSVHTDDSFIQKTKASYIKA